MAKSRSTLLMCAASATVFVSSACIMILELVAGRLIARHLGSSLYTWTSIIGVVLAGIAIGNYLGGRIADRFQAKKALAVLFTLSSVACVTVVCVTVVCVTVVCVTVVCVTVACVTVVCVTIAFIPNCVTVTRPAGPKYTFQNVPNRLLPKN